MRLFISPGHQRFILLHGKDLPIDRLNSTEWEEAASNDNFLFGYCFHPLGGILKNQKIDTRSFEELIGSLGESSGIFCAVNRTEDGIRLCLDPLIQFNLFYGFLGESFVYSNDFLAIALLLGLTSVEPRHIYDIISYLSPMRGLTFIRGIYTVQRCDLIEPKLDPKDKPSPPQRKDIISFSNSIPQTLSSASYSKSLDIYLDKLRFRVAQLSQYSRIESALSGGADSRLVAAILKQGASGLRDKCNFYSFGNSQSADKEVHNLLCLKFNLKSANYVYSCGTNNYSLAGLWNSLIDHNFQKYLNNTYTNGSVTFPFGKQCLLTGYYGANVAGGVVPAPSMEQALKLDRLKWIDPRRLDHYEYIERSFNSYDGIRACEALDNFYLSNRGPSHYASQSLASNLHGDHFDVLYDPINLSLVKNCPYKQEHINKTVITIDLIERVDRDMAFFPYANRVVPSYKDLERLPSPNCFEPKDLPMALFSDHIYIHPVRNDAYLPEYLTELSIEGFGKPTDFLRHAVFDEISDLCPGVTVESLAEAPQITRELLGMICLGLITVKNTCR